MNKEVGSGLLAFLDKIKKIALVIYKTIRSKKEPKIKITVDCSNGSTVISINY